MRNNGKNSRGNGNDYYDDEEEMYDEDLGYEEEYYEDEEYDEYDEEEYATDGGYYAEEEYYEEPVQKREKRERRSEGGIQKILIAMAAGLVVLIGITVGTIVYMNSSAPTSNINANGLIFHQELAGVGTSLNGIDFIGQKGLLAALEAKKLENAALLASGEELEDDDTSYIESDYDTEVEVGVETVSVLKDLKIKFINKNTGKLIANVPFEVSVTNPAGDSKTYTDSDKDGIIYLENIDAGSYKLKVVPLSDAKYEEYAISTTLTADVKASLAYEKVDVADEILDPSKVNESAEDTVRDGADTGSTLTNTVTLVSSTKTEEYIAVDVSKLKINVDYAVSSDKVVASVDKFSPVGVKTEETPTDPGTTPTDPGTTPTDPGTTPTDPVTPADPAKVVKITPAQGNASVNKGDMGAIDIELENITASEISVSSSDPSIATAVLADGTSSLKITGVEKGETTITLTQKNPADGAAPVTASIKVTVVALSRIGVGKTSGTMLPGIKIKYSLELVNMTKAEAVVSNTSDSVATFAIDDAGKEITITAVAVGTTTFTISKKDDTTVAPATITITVVPNNEKITYNDGIDDRKVFVKEGTTYREATYADYSAALSGTSVNFYYLMNKYTGWQTIEGKKYYYTADGKFVTGEQVIDGMLYNFDSKGALVTGGGVLGIDVSKWNGTIDWKKVKNAGVSFVIIRVGYRGSTQGGLIDDANFKKNIEGATAAGLKVGVYFVTQAINDTEAVYEASMVLERIKGYTISYPVFLDVEASGGRGDKISKATRTSVCKTFCKTIANAGYTAGIYANKSWLTNNIDPSQLTSYKIWVAQYYSKCTYTGTYSMWQYSDKGKINGISGDVDLNYSYLGY